MFKKKWFRDNIYLINREVEIWDIQSMSDVEKKEFNIKTRQELVIWLAQILLDKNIIKFEIDKEKDKVVFHGKVYIIEDKDIDRFIHWLR